MDVSVRIVVRESPMAPNLFLQLDASLVENERGIRTFSGKFFVTFITAMKQ